MNPKLCRQSRFSHRDEKPRYHSHGFSDNYEHSASSPVFARFHDYCYDWRPSERVTCISRLKSAREAGAGIEPATRAFLVDAEEPDHLLEYSRPTSTSEGYVWKRIQADFPCCRSSILDRGVPSTRARLDAPERVQSTGRACQRRAKKRSFWCISDASTCILQGAVLRIPGSGSRSVRPT